MRPLMPRAAVALWPELIPKIFMDITNYLLINTCLSILSGNKKYNGLVICSCGRAGSWLRRKVKNYGLRVSIK